MAEKISVAVVNNKVDNLDKKVTDMKSDIKEDLKAVSDKIDSLAKNIQDTNKSNDETYMKKSDFMPYKIALTAVGTFAMAMIIYIGQQLLNRGIN